MLYIVAEHPRWLFCVYELQALGLPVGHDCRFAPYRGNVSNPVLEASFALWEVHVSKPYTYVLKPPKLGAIKEVAHDNIYKS